MNDDQKRERTMAALDEAAARALAEAEPEKATTETAEPEPAAASEDEKPQTVPVGLVSCQGCGKRFMTQAEIESLRVSGPEGDQRMTHKGGNCGPVVNTWVYFVVLHTIWPGGAMFSDHEAYTNVPLVSKGQIHQVVANLQRELPMTMRDPQSGAMIVGNAQIQSVVIFYQFLRSMWRPIARRA